MNSSASCASWATKSTMVSITLGGSKTRCENTCSGSRTCRMKVSRSAASEDDNVAKEPRGSFREFDFEPKAHWDLGPALGIIDFERGVKLSGSRYYVLKGWGARLQRALISFFLDTARVNGYTELYTPYIVHGEMLYGSAQFPKFQDTVYGLADEDKFLLPTAEVATTNMHRDEILEEADLPLNYVAHTPCFRSEKASAGRDVRGIKARASI